MERILYESRKNSCLIINKDGSKIFRAPTATGLLISFNVNYLPEEKYKWFCDTVGGQIDAIIKDAINKTTIGIQTKFKNLIGIDLAL